MGTRIDMQCVVEVVKSAGFAAYVEQTGGGCATIYASRDWEEREVTYLDGPPVPVRYPATHPDPLDPDWPKHDVAAGPGWFEPTWPGGQPFGDSDDFCVGPDDQGDAVPVDCTGMDAWAVGQAIISALRGERTFEARP